VSGIGIDLGTSTTVVCDEAHGIVYEEPSVLLGRGRVGRRRNVVAIGREASELLGRVPAGHDAVRPVQQGVIGDLETGRAYLRAMARRAVPSPWRRAYSRIAVGVPAGATDLERRALLEVADDAGLHRAIAIDEPVAGAIGCGIDPMERRVHMVVDVGGGTSEATAFCFGGVLTSRSTRLAGEEMTVRIARHLREQHQLLVGERTAEEAKIRIGVETEPSVVVPGRDAGSGRLRLVTVPVAEIVEVVQPVVDSIIQTLATCLDELPPEAAGDVLADGVLAFGGGAQTRGLVDRLEEALGFPVKVAENPTSCVAVGAARCLGSADIRKAYCWG
jgi:rod shape-determining protein MreB